MVEVVQGERETEISADGEEYEEATWLIFAMNRQLVQGVTLPSTRDGWDDLQMTLMGSEPRWMVQQLKQTNKQKMAAACDCDGPFTPAERDR